MGARRNVFFLLHRLGRTLERAGQVVFYLAAGTARLDDLRAAIREQWDREGQIDTEAGAAGGLFEWERDFYGRSLRGEDHVLVVGCGTGRDLIALLAQGYRAEGLDVAPHCVALARRVVAARGWDAPIHVGDVERVALPTRYDAVILSTQVYSLIPQSATRIAVLRKLAGHLTPGGRILLSYIRRRPPAPSRTLIHLARLAGALSRSDWRPEYGDVVFLGRPAMFLNYEHRFAPEEVEQEARAAGLRPSFHDTTQDGLAVLVPH
jgi:SAM-dependent methyltransferase